MAESIRAQSSMVKTGCMTDREYIKEFYGVDGETVAEVPRVQHESIFAFLEAIGFDRKRRRYVDSNLTPIRYSVVAKKTEAELAKQREWVRAYLGEA